MRLANNLGARNNSRIADTEHSCSTQNLRASDARAEVAQLLATAYWRLAYVRRVPVNPASNLANGVLALSGDQSVHECD